MLRDSLYAFPFYKPCRGLNRLSFYLLAKFKKSVLINHLFIYFLINTIKSLLFFSSKKDKTRSVRIFNNYLEPIVSHV